MNKIKYALLSAIIVSSSFVLRAETRDPLESINRKIYAFNKVMDNLYLRPIAVTYNTITPYSTRTQLSNFIKNLGEVPTIGNDVLQGKPKKTFKDIARLLINSTLGIFGLFDVASELGIERRKEDLGQTLAHWGYKDSMYLMLPVLGPSTVRDTVGFIGNSYMSPHTYFKPRWRLSYYVASTVSNRAELVDREQVLSSAGVDEYLLIRNAYMQNRGYLINDGESTIDEASNFLGDPPD